MSSELDQVCTVRDYVEADKAFIMATFLRGLYYGDSWFSLIPKDAFMDNYKKIAEALLEHRATTVRVACLNEDPDVILGYSVSTGPVLHWVFVKQVWRNKGVGRRLLPTSISAFTHLTTLGKSLMHKFPNSTFNPFLIGG